MLYLLVSYEFFGIKYKFKIVIIKGSWSSIISYITVSLHDVMLHKIYLKIDITGAFLLFFAPYLAVQKRILNKLGTFRSLHNELRAKVNELMEHNDILTKNVDRLEGSVSELKEVEAELAKIAETDDVERLVNIVAENKIVNEKMKVNGS